ncbi:NUDIX domain-containing protein [Candidatus Dojkabacteria bacterium]|nr:NUDIX domain-containing protein [Candidatus Dojkabacteria bacterium]
MRDATLCFLVKESNNKIIQICLAKKKRGFGTDKWNGAGGKVMNETIEEAMIRETIEEIDVVPLEYVKVAELTFQFKENPAFNQKVYSYLATSWKGNPSESDEMKPRWFEVDEIPYYSMWDDDKHWLPLVLNKKKLTGKFLFNQKNKIIDHKINVVNKF